jgi:(S)-ureidoglycine-glyoxylate aminotransferase
VLAALTTPVIGQFDPEFTAIMDDVVQLGRQAFLTSYPRCFPVSGLRSAGLEAALNSLLEHGDEIAIGGGPTFVSQCADIARRLGLNVVAVDAVTSTLKLVVFPFFDPIWATRASIPELVQTCHDRGARALVDATMGLGASELRIDDWSVDACVAGVDYAVGAPSGMALVTYSPELEARLNARLTTPRVSYLDLRQLQKYWSPERLNHHTAPTSLVYGVREALRLVHEEDLVQRWARHTRCGQELRDGLLSLGLEVTGDLPYSIVHLPLGCDETASRRVLLHDFSVYVTRIGPRAWRLGLLGEQAHPEHVRRVLAALEKVLDLR